MPDDEPDRGWDLACHNDVTHVDFQRSYCHDPVSVLPERYHYVLTAAVYIDSSGMKDPSFYAIDANDPDSSGTSSLSKPVTVYHAMALQAAAFMRRCNLSQREHLQCVDLSDGFNLMLSGEVY